MENEILKLINDYWKFDEFQQPMSSWHDKQDLIEAVKKQLQQHNVSYRAFDKEPINAYDLNQVAKHFPHPKRKRHGS